MRLVLSLLLLVVRVQSLNFDNYDITWDLPVPTKSTFLGVVNVTTGEDRMATSAYLLSPDPVSVTDNLIPVTEFPTFAPVLLTTNAKTTVTTAQPLASALTTSSLNLSLSNVVAETTLSLKMDGSVIIPRETTLSPKINGSVRVPSASVQVTTYSSPVVSSSNPRVENVVPLGSAMFKRGVVTGTLDDNLAELSKLETELSQDDNMSSPSSANVKNVTLDDLVYELLALEEEVKDLNTSTNSTSESKPISDNIWHETANFLSTPNGFAFFATILVLG